MKTISPTVTVWLHVALTSRAFLRPPIYLGAFSLSRLSQDSPFQCNFTGRHKQPPSDVMFPPQLIPASNTTVFKFFKSGCVSKTTASSAGEKAGWTVQRLSLKDNETLTFRLFLLKTHIWKSTRWVFGKSEHLQVWQLSCWRLYEQYTRSIHKNDTWVDSSFINNQQVDGERKVYYVNFPALFRSSCHIVRSGDGGGSAASGSFTHLTWIQLSVCHL